MTDLRRGVIAMIVACTLWGLSPIFYKIIGPVPATEVLAHRTFWSLVFFVALLAIQGRLAAFGAALTTPALVKWMALAATLISVNWFLFIYAVQMGRTIETSLGYYIFPLMAVLLGVVFFKERMSRARLLAVALAALAVALLAFGLGALPWMSLALATTFGFYGVLKKRLALGPVISVAAEVALLTPLALIWLIWLHAGQGAQVPGIFGRDLQTSLLLVVSGPVTALPLVLFSYASQRVALSTVGLLQYINPTLQFVCAVVIFREPFTAIHATAFALIWVALGIYSLAASGEGRARRKIAMTTSGDAPVVTKPASDASAKP